MTEKMNKQLFFKLADKIKEEFDLSVSTLDEMEKFRQENPKRYQELTQQFESLSEKNKE